MILCDGDVIQKNELKKGTVYDYLIKLDNFAFNNETAPGKPKNLLTNPAFFKKK